MDNPETTALINSVYSLPFRGFKDDVITSQELALTAHMCSGAALLTLLANFPRHNINIINYKIWT